MDTIKRGRPRSQKIASQWMHCDHHDQDCEHRQWRRGLDKDGNVRLVWLCATRQNEVNKAAYARRAEERK